MYEPLRYPNINKHGVNRTALIKKAKVFSSAKQDSSSFTVKCVKKNDCSNLMLHNWWGSAVKFVSKIRKKNVNDWRYDEEEMCNSRLTTLFVSFM